MLRFHEISSTSSNFLISLVIFCQHKQLDIIIYTKLYKNTMYYVMFAFTEFSFSFFELSENYIQTKCIIHVHLIEFLSNSP